MKPPPKLLAVSGNISTDFHGHESDPGNPDGTQVALVF